MPIIGFNTHQISAVADTVICLFFNWDENRRTYIVPIPFLKERFGVPCFVWGSFPPHNPRCNLSLASQKKPL